MNFFLSSVPYSMGVNYTTIARQARDQIRSTFMDSLALLCSVPLDILELHEGLFFFFLSTERDAGCAQAGTDPLKTI